MNILEIVNEKYEELSPVQKRIADYVFKYPDVVCFYSLKDLAEALGVTEVTILRFAKKLGLSNYVEMKKKLREHLQFSLSHGDTLNRVADRMGGRTVESFDRDRLYRDFAENEMSVIQNTYKNLRCEEAAEAASIIRGAETVYVIGNELASSIAEYLSRRFLTIGLRVVDLSRVSRAIFNDLISHAGPEDAAVIISFPGYAKHVLNATKYLKKMQVPQVVLTDKSAAPVAVHATTVLQCDNHDLFFYNSVLGFLSVCSLLVYFVAMEDLEETNRRRGRISEAREEIGLQSLVENDRS